MDVDTVRLLLDLNERELNDVLQSDPNDAQFSDEQLALNLYGEELETSRAHLTGLLEDITPRLDEQNNDAAEGVTTSNEDSPSIAPATATEPHDVVAR